MANLILAWGNEIDRATLAGGLWQGTLPLANLQTRPLGKPARSNGLALTSTKFTTTFSGSLPTIDCIALVKHNLSATAKWRITATNADEGKTKSTGWMDIWPEMDPATIEWEDPRWWDGKPDAELIAQFTPLLIWTGGKALWPAAEDVANPAKWKIEIDDAANPAGYVQIGRVFMGRAFQPAYNINWNAGLGYETATKVEEALLGGEYFDPREGVRVFKFRTDFLNDAEAYGAVMAIQRRVGIHGEVIVIPDEDATDFALQRNIYGRLRTLSPIENPYYQIHGNAWEVKETIA